MVTVAKAGAAEISTVNIKTYFILNKVHPKIRNPALAKRVQSAFKLPVAGMVPLTEEIILAQSQYVFSDRYPNHPFSKEIQLIASRVFGVKPKPHLELMQYLLMEIKKMAGITINELMSLKNVKAERCRFYVGSMIESGFIQSNDGKFSITSKGERYLKKYKTIRKFVDDFRL